MVRPSCVGIRSARLAARAGAARCAAKMEAAGRQALVTHERGGAVLAHGRRKTGPGSAARCTGMLLHAHVLHHQESTASVLCAHTVSTLPTDAALQTRLTQVAEFLQTLGIELWCSRTLAPDRRRLRYLFPEHLRMAHSA